MTLGKQHIGLRSSTAAGQREIGEELWVGREWAEDCSHRWCLRCGGGMKWGESMCEGQEERKVFAGGRGLRQRV